MHTLRNFALVFGVLTFTAFGGQAADTIVVDPVVQSYDSFPEMKTAKKFFVDSVMDSARERASSGLVGYVHVRFKHPTAIICRPHPDSAVGRSLETILAKKGRAAADKGSATQLVRITVLTFDLKETPHFLNQTIAVTVRLKIDVIDPQTSQVTRSFSIDSQRSRPVFDSPRNSKEIILNAVGNALAEVVRELDGI